MRNWIDTNGGDSTKVRFVELPWWQMPAALQAHTVDAASTNEVSDPDLGKPNDPLRLIADVFGSIAPRFASGGVDQHECLGNGECRYREGFRGGDARSRHLGERAPHRIGGNRRQADQKDATRS